MPNHKAVTKIADKAKTNNWGIVINILNFSESQYTRNTRPIMSKAAGPLARIASPRNAPPAINKPILFFFSDFFHAERIRQCSDEKIKKLNQGSIMPDLKYR